MSTVKMGDGNRWLEGYSFLLRIAGLQRYHIVRRTFGLMILGFGVLQGNGRLTYSKRITPMGN
jgi:hypothetical protein